MYTDSAAELRRRGLVVVPAPREITFAGPDVRIPRMPTVGLHGVDADHPAVALVRDGLASAASGRVDGPGGEVSLAVDPGCVETGTVDGQDAQAYRLAVRPGRIEIRANAPAGLIYGAATLVQLASSAPAAGMPRCTVVDWPAYPLRIAHWDTKHHQNRPEALRHTLDWMARLKLNAVSFELEDKFEYPSHPVVGAPGAYTTAELADLTRYALARGIQIIPNVQAPAHLCYVLKHPEFAHLRCDGSNYQACMDEPEVRRLIFDLYDDACRATPGVAWFHVSTDEVYYAGICERFRKPYDPVNRSLTFVEYVNAAHAFLAERGRRIIVWAEFPLLPEHVDMLAPDIVDGIVGNDAFACRENARGIRQLVYAPVQGEELLFPGYYPFTDAALTRQQGRLGEVDAVTRTSHATRGRPIGTFTAAWDDAGLHDELFWPGYAAMSQVGWTGSAQDSCATVADFARDYCGAPGQRLSEAYRAVQELARFFDETWERRPSRVRKPAYGSSYGKRPVTRTDLTLEPPPVPASADLSVPTTFRRSHTVTAARLAAARRTLEELGPFLAALERDVPRNRHHVEVLGSIAELVAQHVRMLEALARIDASLASASASHRAGAPASALAALETARGEARAVGTDRLATLARVGEVWERSRHPRNRSVAGRSFVHVMDDVKDHFADRRTDLSYMTAPQESIGLDAWARAVGEVVAAYAAAHGLEPTSCVADREQVVDLRRPAPLTFVRP